MAWIVDYVAGVSKRERRDPAVAGRCRELRRRVELSLRASREPPDPPSGLLSRPDWVPIPGGRFRMGTESDDREGDLDERPAIDVTRSGFEILRHEVTEAEWSAFTGEAPEPADVPDEKSDDLPVVGTTWYRAYAFAAWLVPGGRFPRKPSGSMRRAGDWRGSGIRGGPRTFAPADRAGRT